MHPLHCSLFNKSYLEKCLLRRWEMTSNCCWLTSLSLTMSTCNVLMQHWHAQLKQINSLLSKNIVVGFVMLESYILKRFATLFIHNQCQHWYSLWLHFLIYITTQLHYLYRWTLICDVWYIFKWLHYKKNSSCDHSFYWICMDITIAWTIIDV